MNANADGVARPAPRADLVGVALVALGAIAFSGKAIIVKLGLRLGADAVTLLALRMLVALPLFLLMGLWAARRAAPLSTGDRWRVFARNVHSLRDHKAIETFAGVEYTSCCWRARLIGRRYVSNRTGERDTAVALQVELLGLSSVGKSSDAFLEHTVRGYSRDLSTPLP